MFRYGHLPERSSDFVCVRNGMDLRNGTVVESGPGKERHCAILPLEKTRPSILGLYPCQSAIYGDTASWGQERQGGLAVYKQEAGIPGPRLCHF